MFRLHVGKNGRPASTQSHIPPKHPPGSQQYSLRRGTHRPYAEQSENSDFEDLVRGSVQQLQDMNAEGQRSVGAAKSFKGLQFCIIIQTMTLKSSRYNLQLLLPSDLLI